MVSIIKRFVKNKHINEFIKYLIVSCALVIIDYSAYRGIFATQVFSKASSGTISYLIGLFISYFILKKYVFVGKIIKKKTHNEFLLFLVSGILGAGITYTTIRLYEAIVTSNGHLAKILAMGVSFFIVYLFRKLLVFK
jgi:putative flippase GtrA